MEITPTPTGSAAIAGTARTVQGIAGAVAGSNGGFDPGAGGGRFPAAALLGSPAQDGVLVGGIQGALAFGTVIDIPVGPEIVVVGLAGGDDGADAEFMGNAHGLAGGGTDPDEGPIRISGHQVALFLGESPIRFVDSVFLHEQEETVAVVAAHLAEGELLRTTDAIRGVRRRDVFDDDRQFVCRIDVDQSINVLDPDWTNLLTVDRRPDACDHSHCHELFFHRAIPSYYRA